MVVEIDKEEVVRRYTTGDSLRAIAKEFDTNAKRIQRILISEGVGRRKKRVPKPAPEHKTCSRCKETKYLDEFGKNKRAPWEKDWECKTCRSEASGDHRIKREYGISRAGYDGMFESQGGVCAICGGTNATSRLAVDHDHLTGNIRGLLCIRCNAGLGLFRDDPTILSAAIDYLQNSVDVS